MSQFCYQRNYRGGIQAVIFDWAGTTLDYGCCAPALVFVDVFRCRGVDISLEEARGPMGKHKRVHIEQLTQLPRIRKAWEEMHGKPPTSDDVEAMFSDFIPKQLKVLADYSQLIPGALETISACRDRGLKIGSTTGYNAEMMEIVTREAANQGYEPDCMICVSDVQEGRPSPWMAIENAHRLGVYPFESCVKIGDTAPDIAEGLNGGMWTIGVAKAGNEMGLRQKEVESLDADDLQRRLTTAYARLHQAGAHYVVDSVADILPCLDDIESRLQRGERP